MAELMPPTIFSVPMRRDENIRGWRLKGVVLQRGIHAPFWWSVEPNTLMTSGAVQTIEDAIPKIESAITRIREEAGRLGT
jgi:hypothetical protein